MSEVEQPTPPAAPVEPAAAALMLAALLLTLGLMVMHGDWDDPGWWMTAPFVAVWCFVPYAWAGRTLRAVRGDPGGGAAATLGTALVVAVALWVMWRYHLHEDTTRGGRVFLMLPVWQGLLFAPVALWLRWRRRAAA